MTASQGPIESAKSLIWRRPAETAAATAGAVGLLLSRLFDGADNDLKTALVILLAALPAAVSYVHDLGRSRHLPHNLAREVEELALRAARRARLGHSDWNADLEAATKLAELRTKLSPPPPRQVDDRAASDTGRTGA